MNRNFEKTIKVGLFYVRVSKNHLTNDMFGAEQYLFKKLNLVVHSRDSDSTSVTNIYFMTINPSISALDLYGNDFRNRH